MKNIQNDQQNRYKTRRNSKYISILILTITSLTIVSCSAIGEIFKAGMGFGIFIVVAIIVLVVILVLRFGKGKNS